MTTLVLLGALALIAVQAPGQERRQRQGGREDVEGLMQAYVISKLQEALDLNDEQFAQMVVAQKRLSSHRREFRRRRTETLQQMRQALQSGGADEGRLTALLKELDELQKAFEAQQRQDYQAIDAVLNVRQRARYRILEQEIQRRFQQMVREIRARQPPRRPRP